MFYTVYKTTHLESGKIYIGMHTTTKADDSYLGSGTLISRAIAKHGRDAFSKEVLFIFATPEEMIAKEKELVDEAFCARDDTYNLNVGGDGGWFRANQVYSSEARSRSLAVARSAQALLLESDPSFQRWKRESGLRLAAFNAEKGEPPKMGFLGKRHSERSKLQIGEANKDLTGIKNSQFGTRWVVRAEESRKIRAEELPTYLVDGWVEGRKLKAPRPEARFARGSACHNAKLTEELASEIRERYALGGVTQRALALLYGVSQPAINYILKGSTWGTARVLREV